MTQNFGEALGRGLHAQHRPVLVARSLRRTDVTVTEVRLERPTHERSDSLPGEDTYAVAVQLRDFPKHEWWEDGRQAPVLPIAAGQVTMYHLRRDPRFRINHPFHSIHFQLPRAFLDAVALESGIPHPGELVYRSGVPFDDPVIAHLALALRPSFAHPDRADRLFVDSVTTALATHVLTRYGDLRRPLERPRPRGGLGPQQLRRALALLDARLTGDVRVDELAAECRLSTGYFVQAFKTTVGMAPHRWLLRRRIERSLTLLRDPARPTAEIALACGFADQSHFTRTFRAFLGCPPVRWRHTRGRYRHDAAGYPVPTTRPTPPGARGAPA